MTTLHEELVGSTHPACIICQFLQRDANAAEWRLELRDSGIGHAAVVAALIRRGVNVTEASVRRHRAGHL